MKRERLNVKRDSAGLVCVGMLLLAATLCLSFSPAFAQTTLAPPQGLRVFDTPSDGGGSLTVLWSPASYDSAAAKYQVLLSEGTTVPDLAAMKVVAEFPANQRYVRESKWPWWTRPTTGEQHQFTLRNGKGVELKNGNAYSITVAAVLNDDRVIATPVQATPQPNWLNWNQMNNLILALLFGGIVFYAIGTARKREIFLRRIPGLDAVDEAIGRATELGKPILYMTGAHDMSDPSTIAAAVILGRVAKRAAAYETDLLVPHREPITMAVCQEITKQAYLEAGKPDLYKDDSNFFITSDQFSYTAAVDGIMLRKKPAANFFMGSLLCRSAAVDGNGCEHRCDPNRRDRRRSPAAVLRHDLRLHLDRGGALRCQCLSLQRTGSGRHAARTGHRQGAHPRRPRHRDHTGHSRGPARRCSGHSYFWISSRT